MDFLTVKSIMTTMPGKQIFSIDNFISGLLMDALRRAAIFVEDHPGEYSLKRKRIECIEVNRAGGPAIAFLIYKNEITPENFMTHEFRSVNDFWLCVYYEKATGDFLEIRLEK